ncbi:hypothetical protein SNEBB_006562 [Seison nebaliae]|nr:hypothetical protein SNEBB_006562 [Seison nebaliae]
MSEEGPIQYTSACMSCFKEQPRIGMEIDDFENEDTKCFIPKNNGNNKGKLNILSSSDEDSDSDEEISDISIDEKLEDENKKQN